MRQNVKNNIKLGFFVSLGLALFIAVMYFLGAQENLFSPATTIYATFKDVSGLKEGSNVRFAGINVGTVKEIKIVSDSTVRMVMTIDKSASRFIKEDSKVTIGSEGLIGARLVNIMPGSPGAAPVSSHDELNVLEPVSIDDVIHVFRETGEFARYAIEDLSDLTSRIRRGEGLLGAVIADSALSRDAGLIVDRLEKSSVNLSRISADFAWIADQVKSGEGTLGQLLTSDEAAVKLNDILDSLSTASRHAVETTQELAGFAEKMNREENTLHRIMTDTALINDINDLVRTANQTAKEIDIATQKINNSWLLNGLLGGQTNEEKNKENVKPE